MAEQEAATRTRRGGRSARKAERAAPVAVDDRPVRGGLTGGRYRPLSQPDVLRINEAVMDVLERIGFADALPTCIEACTRIGAVYGDDGRLRFPRAVVEDVIANAARDVTLHAQDPAHDLHPQGQRVYFGTAGAAVHVADPITHEYRDSTLADLYDAARLVNVLDNIHFFQRPMVARDLVDPLALDLNTVYAAVSGTNKHVGTSFVVGENVAPSLELLHMVAGGEAKWRERPFVSNSNCFVVPPLKFAEDACKVLEACVHGGMPVLLLSAGQAGATAPAAIAGAVVQATAEVLGGLVSVHALKPGHPAILGTWPFVSDLRTGAMSGGSGEQALLTTACAQMAQFYNLPGGSAAGMADAKLPDMQSGFEKGITNVTAGLSGLNLVYEAAGMHASLLGFCLESLVIENDLLGQAMRCVRGIEVNDETLSIETIEQVCTQGPGHFLGHDQTLSLMRSEYVYPNVGNRMSPKEWEEAGKPLLIDEAVARTREMLRTEFPTHIPREVDAALRTRFEIALPASRMARG